ncbi:PPR containing protein [Tasmannia lanceolata]|uniref:PPR containing protein n=1 Tax=Tasmannia lanceolata TaxID=3420 RepID=UPI0040637C03
MASSSLILSPPYPPPLLSSLFFPPSKPPTKTNLPFISCGPRNNRGPLVRGRTLSTEAILAIQTLKRASKSPNPSSSIHLTLSKTLSRLIKPDLLASLRELLRQNQCHLALHVFSAVRLESWYKTDYSLYAEIISALARNKLMAEIDELVSDLVEEGFYGGDNYGLGRLIKALIAADRGKGVAEIYGLMKRGSCVMDEFMFRVLNRGLRRLGEVDVADEVERDFATFS